MARGQEGWNLAEDIKQRLGVLGKWLVKLKELIPAVLEEKRAALTERIATLVKESGVEIPEDRMLTEIAVLTDRLDVSEELTRLSVHLDRLGKVLDQEGEIGKKLDFLLQETFREINTCGNKSQNPEVSNLVVEFKAELEKCREQVQNLE